MDYEVLLVADESQSQHELKDRLSGDCDIVRAFDIEGVRHEIAVHDKRFAACVIDTSVMGRETIEIVKCIREADKTVETPSSF